MRESYGLLPDKLDADLWNAQRVAETLEERSLPISWLRDQLRVASEWDADQVKIFVYMVLQYWRGDLRVTDLANARRVAALHADQLRHCAALGWLRWDGRRWCSSSVAAMHYAKGIPQTWKQDAEVIRATVDLAESDIERQMIWERASAAAKTGDKLESAARLKAMVELASTEPSVVIDVADLDADPWLLNVLNGTIDLRTGNLYRHDRLDLITRLAPVPYMPSASHPVWEKFLEDSTGGDVELGAYLQRATGCSLVGSNVDEVLFLLFGPGGSGKSTFVDAVRMALGDYSATADFETFVKKSGGSGIRNDIARLKGARIVTSIEVDEGKELAEGLIKTITGGDNVSARFLYKEFFEFVPSFTLWLVANHAPGFDADDDAMVRRIRVLPFPYGRDQAHRDPTVKATLKDPKAAGPAILAWMVDGCLSWQENGLGTAGAVEAASKDYRDEMDVVADFIADCCDVGPDCRVESANLYMQYRSWAQQNGYVPILTGTAFGRRLTKKHFSKTKVNGQRGWQGMRMKSVSSAASAWGRAALQAGITGD